MIRILIIDDQKSIRENIRLILSADSNFEVVGTAANGYQGIELADNLEPDIILMDLEMPKLDGLTTTKLISQKNPDQNIVILTIKDEDKLLIQALNAGAKGYLLKNSDAKEIINTINLIYEGNKLSHQSSSSFSEVPSIEPEIEHQSQPSFVVPELTNSSPNFANSSPILEQTLSWESLGERTTTTESKFDFAALLSVIKRRYPPALMGFCGVLLGAILYLAFAKKAYQATASIILQNRQESISELGKDLSNIGESKEYSPLASQIEFIKSRLVLKNALKNVAQKEKNFSSENISLNTIKQVQGNLDVTIIPNTNIIKISYVDGDPKFAATLLNEIVNSVKRRNIDSIREEATSVRKFLEQEVSKQKNEVNQVKAAENVYREREGIISLDNQTTNLVNNLNELETKKQELSVGIKEQESKVNNLQQVANVDNAKSAYVEGKIGQDQQLAELREQLSGVEGRLAAARSNFTENNPAVIDLKEEKANILALQQEQINRVVGEQTIVSTSGNRGNSTSKTENGVGEKILADLITNQVQLDADRDKLQVVQAEINSTKERISLLPSKVQSLTDLVNQQKQANESLQFLQRKLEEARIAEAQLVGNFQIVESASVPESPSSPNVPAVIAIATFMAAALMAAIMFLLEKIDRTLYDVEDIEQSLNIPFLTSLPSLQDHQQHLSHMASFLNDTTLCEPYRFLLKRLESYAQNNCKVIVITSATAGEGKSTVASHLGAVSSMLSKRTLIIDAHLHSPTQHSLFKVKLKPGLREVTTGGLTLLDAVQPTKIKNLSVLTAGNSVANSWMVLESPRMKNILQEASLKYDLVIIDTPPVSSSCDAYTLSKYSSGLMMVTRPFHTPKDVLEQTVSDLKRDKASIIGFAINNVQKQKQKQKLDDLTEGGIYALPAPSDSKSAKNSRKDVEEVRQS